jgi:hypothetical protein
MPTLDIRYNDNSTQNSTDSNTYFDSLAVADIRLCTLCEADGVTRTSCDSPSSIFQYSQQSDVDSNVEHCDTNVVMHIDASELQDLLKVQRSKLWHILNDFSDCFAETSGICPYVEH